ncbi:MAG: prephenate dehydrogenase/arogenate dehydrogenase family protein [Planctomycetes bacterium]|nr:prephenate dehydrogenase/arogenate dehydrogenase family protein [Planctomycetota bacterium]
MPVYQQNVPQNVAPKVTIVGVGLIGGSIGLALGQRGLAKQIVGVGRRQQSLDRALACGAIGSATVDLAAGVAAADVVIVATPVESVVEDVCRALAAAPAGVLVTDVGSTKTNICEAVADNEVDSCGFVGSHPLAGDHRSGPEHARGDLFDGKTVVVTPTKATLPETTERAEVFWKSLGAQVVQMPPEQHDRALATTSHLPHLVASALAASTPPEWLPLAATGWADTTRIAAADPKLWTQIFAQNTPSVIAALDCLIEQLQAARSNLVADESTQIEKFLHQAKRTRDALGN